jgi:hypothetical protein
LSRCILPNSPEVAATLNAVQWSASFLGIIFTPIGMILGSFFGFITGTGLKTIVSVILMWKIIVFAF